MTAHRSRRRAIVTVSVGFAVIAALCVVGLALRNAPPDYVWCPPLLAAYLVSLVVVYVAATIDPPAGIAGAFVLAAPLYLVCREYMDRVVDDKGVAEQEGVVMLAPISQVVICLVVGWVGAIVAESRRTY